MAVSLISEEREMEGGGRESRVELKLTRSPSLELTDFAGFLFRVVPVSGKVFISTNHFCFKATALLYKTTVSSTLSSPESFLFLQSRR